MQNGRDCQSGRLPLQVAEYCHSSPCRVWKTYSPLYWSSPEMNRPLFQTAGKFLPLCCGSVVQRCAGRSVPTTGERRAEPAAKGALVRSKAVTCPGLAQAGIPTGRPEKGNGPADRALRRLPRCAGSRAPVRSGAFWEKGSSLCRALRRRSCREAPSPRGKCVSPRRPWLLPGPPKCFSPRASGPIPCSCGNRRR